MKSMSLFLKEHRPTFLAVLAIWFMFSVVVLLLIYLDFPVMTLPNFGMLGDSFNIITSLFTGLAFAGVVLSVVLQTKELGLQRKELKATRKEFKGQTEQLAKQATHLEKQQQEMVSQSFDNKFFQMLNMFNTNVASLNIQNSTGAVIAGKEAMSKTLEYFDKGSNLGFNEAFASINTSEHILRPYCINLYQILKYVDTHTPEKSTLQFIRNPYSMFRAPRPKEYTNIIRAQLSSDELILLMYNAIGVIPFSGKKYKKLLEKYAFFEHLNVDYLYKNNERTTHIDSILKQYNIKVAGDNKRLKGKMQELQKPKQK